MFRFIEFKTRDGFCEDRCGHTCSMRLLASCQRVIIRGCRVSVLRTQSQLHPSASISFPSLHARGNYRQAVASIYLCSFTLLAATSIVHTHSALVHREFCLRVDGVGNPAFCLTEAEREMWRNGVSGGKGDAGRRACAHAGIDLIWRRRVRHTIHARSVFFPTVFHARRLMFGEL